MNFKVGEKVWCLHGSLGITRPNEHYYVIDISRCGKKIRVTNKLVFISQDYFINYEIYNSPLYKALIEQSEKT